MRKLALTFALCLAVCSSGVAADKLELLIVDGQNNHQWQKTTPILKAFLEQTGRFRVDVATSPPKKSQPDAWKTFRPQFAKYDVVLSNYNGEPWPEEVQKNLEQYVAGGGGLVIVHAANNAFPGWPEWNKMIGLGWRNAKYGPRVTVNDDGDTVRTEAGEGPGAGHGPQHEFSIVIRDRGHAVMDGIPAEWMHFKDELYHGQRGPAQNMHILATAYSDPAKRGTGAHEPMVWWIPYGEGRVFTNVMGHADYSMHCVGFQTVTARGAEWVATGEVTLPVPKNFPSAGKTSTQEP
ncbi:ThuA domain-containing protein [Thalassoroseus pseudoceratinae]|uniref:ThuA domain-containing protein n=1 Tax=Thalassoroseus pseudoceratinae TaxID=2713176 RepID=UPI00141FAEAA|nr:ThuA domain-containing protein [Thalassoroseus pseudoceratinae]